MAISPTLRQFVSSGVYRLTFDKSQTVTYPSETTRLIIGFSKQGVFNSPVYCANSEAFIDIFGNIDESLERRGSFFHRTALTALTRGPIIALNLLDLGAVYKDGDNAGESIYKSDMISFSSVSSELNEMIQKHNVKEYYNTDKFWYPDFDELKKLVNPSSVNKPLLHFANIGRKNITVVTRKSDIKGYDVTAREWYGAGRVPEFLNEYDYMSDYMIDVILIEGDFSDYNKLKTDPIFGPYFNENGLVKDYVDYTGKKMDGLNTFLNLKQVNVMAVYTGSLIPQLQDNFGNVMYIQEIVNSETTKTGILAAVNEEYFEGEGTVSGKLVDLIGHTLFEDNVTDINFLSHKGNFDSLKSKGCINDNSNFVYDVINPHGSNQTGFDFMLFDFDSFSSDFVGGLSYKNDSDIVDKSNTNILYLMYNYKIDSYKQEYDEENNIFKYIKYENNNKIIDIKIGDYLLNKNGDRLTKVVNASNFMLELKSPEHNIWVELFKVETTEPISIKQKVLQYNIASEGQPEDIEEFDYDEIIRVRDITQFMNNYELVTLKGYKLDDNELFENNGKGKIKQNEILQVLYDTNLANSLKDKDVISFRYIVDTFEGTIERDSKMRLSMLAKDRENAFAILNMPSVKQFRESTQPLFKLNATSSFDSKYIASGGNLDLNPQNSFSLPNIDGGSNFGAWYGPNLIIRERGTNKSIPPAAYVSNLYMNKLNQGNPYDIIAGPRRGVVSGNNVVGIEYSFDRYDLDNIEPMGYNAIVNRKGIGLMINANQTGQQGIKSALSQIHVRELIIYIQDSIEAILKNYQWEYNTPQVRLEIKTLADNLLGQIQSDGGIYSFNNIMDTSNNTNEIIDNNMGILDTYIEPVRGLGVLVHRTTILKTGDLASSTN